MEQVILVIYVLLAAAMVGLILLQQGKGADAGASFGAGASQTVFGSVGAGNVLTRSTAILATLFFLFSVGLAVMAKHKAEAAREGGIPLSAEPQSKDNAPVALGDIPASEKAQVAVPASPSSDIPTASQAEVPEQTPAVVGGEEPAVQEKPGSPGE
jgi:preprotein translocase subunit SecG